MITWLSRSEIARHRDTSKSSIFSTLKFPLSFFLSQSRIFPVSLSLSLYPKGEKAQASRRRAKKSERKGAKKVKTAERARARTHEGIPSLLDRRGAHIPGAFLNNRRLTSARFRTQGGERDDERKREEGLRLKDSVWSRMHDDSRRRFYAPRRREGERERTGFSSLHFQAGNERTSLPCSRRRRRSTALYRHRLESLKFARAFYLQVRACSPLCARCLSFVRPALPVTRSSSLDSPKRAAVPCIMRFRFFILRRKRDGEERLC